MSIYFLFSHRLPQESGVTSHFKLGQTDPQDVCLSFTDCSFTVSIRETPQPHPLVDGQVLNLLLGPISGGILNGEPAKCQKAPHNLLQMLANSSACLWLG